MAGTGPTGGSGEAGNGSARSPAGRETSGPQTAQEGKGRKERPKRDQAAGKQQENFILVGWEGGSGSVGGQERAAEISCPVSVPVSQGSSIEIPVSGMRINNSLILSFLGCLGCFGCLGQSRRPTEPLGLRSNTPRQHSERHPDCGARGEERSTLIPNNESSAMGFEGLEGKRVIRLSQNKVNHLCSEKISKHWDGGGSNVQIVSSCKTTN